VLVRERCGSARLYDRTAVFQSDTVTASLGSEGYDDFANEFIGFQDAVGRALAKTLRRVPLPDLKHRLEPERPASWAYRGALVALPR
jgi:hypothetical protein